MAKAKKGKKLTNLRDESVRPLEAESIRGGDGKTTHGVQKDKMTSANKQTAAIRALL